MTPDLESVYYRVGRAIARWLVYRAEYWIAGLLFAAASAVYAACVH